MWHGDPCAEVQVALPCGVAPENSGCRQKSKLAPWHPRYHGTLVRDPSCRARTGDGLPSQPSELRSPVSNACNPRAAHSTAETRRPDKAPGVGLPGATQSCSAHAGGCCVAVASSGSVCSWGDGVIATLAATQALRCVAGVAWGRNATNPVAGIPVIRLWPGPGPGRNAWLRLTSVSYRAPGAAWRAPGPARRVPRA